MTSQRKILQGVIKRHPDGFGFFICDSVEHADVYIPANAMRSAMTNDRVSIFVEKERDGRFRGEVVRITERSQKKIAGKFAILNDQYGMIKDEGKGWGADLRILLTESMSAKSGDLVAAEITEYPDQGVFAGKVVEVIGDATSALNDIRRVIISQNVPDRFSNETLAEAKQFQSNPIEADFKDRKDLRSLSIITIDGATAKDFDDAVYTEMTGKGFLLYVAIADVSHYVRTGTAMDKDAYERGTSVYFPNFVVPMLPEALSNGLCSLNPNVPRLALVAEMNFDFNGEMQNSKFYEAVIQSQARVTYGQAQEIVEGNELKQFNHVKDNILRCADLAKVLMARRFKEGSLDLEVPETELVIDGAGEPVDVIKSERLFAHRLIEELMLAANVAVAKYFGAKDIPAMYRIHEPPDAMKMSLLQKYMQNFGAKVDLSGDKLQKKLTRALQEFSHDAQGGVIHILTLRSMSQAKYTMDNIGHFGLGFDHYTHFTSPIRRYPDLIVHRLLKSIIGVPGYRLLPPDDLQTAGTWLSACEQRSAKSERQIQAIKKARFMHKMVGETFEGMVSSVTKFGVFVLLRQYNVDGLVRLDDLGIGHWDFDEENLRLVAKKSGLSYSLGDVLRVTVSAVDVEQGQINFVLEGRVATASTGNRKDNKSVVFSSKSKDRRERGGPEQRGAQGKKFSGKEKQSGKNREKGREQGQESSREKEKYADKKGGSSKGRNRHENRGALENRFAKAASDPKPFVRSTKTVKPPIDDKAKRIYRTPSTETVEKSNTSEIKPRYKSLSDYLDQMKDKFNGKNTSSSADQKPAFGASKNRKNTEKRQPSEDDSGGVRKTRTSKFGRKGKSR